MESFKFKRGFKTESEKKALDYRKVLDLKTYDPLPAEIISQYLNIKILAPSDILNNKSINYSILTSSKDWSALTLISKVGNRIIIHNDRHSKARKESDLMHEIAHVICKHDTSERTKINGEDILLRTYNEEQEKEAEWLGGCMQLPREALLWHLRRNVSVKEIATIFSASESMVRFRINSTGVKHQAAKWY